MPKVQLKNGQTSVILRVFIPDSSVTTGAGKTGLAFSSSGLIISTIADNEASPTTYTAAGSTIETITTLGTFAAPTATKCRFKEVDATNFPGVYEIQVADARWAVSSAKSLLVSVVGATNAAPVFAEVQLTSFDPYDSVRGALTALPNAAAGANGGLPLGNASGRVDVGNWLGSAPDALSSGKVAADLKLWLASAPDALSSGKVPADLKLWLTVAPNALASGKVDAAPFVRTGTAQAGAAGSITLDASASATNDLYKGQYVYIASGTGAGQVRLITGYTGSTQVATVAPNWVTNPSSSSVFVVGASAGSDVELWGGSAPNALQSGRVDAYAGALASAVIAAASFAAGAIDAAAIATDAIGSAELAATAASEIATAVAAAILATPANLLATDASGRVDLSKVLGSTINALQSGRVDSYLGAGATGVITATLIAADAIGASELAADAVTEIRDAILSDATTFAGADIATIKGRLPTALTAGGNIKADVIAISGDTTAADNEESFFDGTGYAGTNNVIPTVTAVTNDVGITQAGADKAWSTATRALTDKVGFALSSAGVQAIWDALTSALTTVGSVGKLLVDNLNATISSRSSHSAADVWAVGTRTLSAFSFAVDISAAAVTLIWDKATSALTTVGSIGKLLVDNLNATISSRASQTSLDAVDDYVDTEVAAIKAKTDNLPASPANEATLTTIASYVDTEVAAIKAKTDNLPATPAATGDAMTLADGAITAAKIATDAITAAKIAADAIGASELASDAVTEIQSGLATSANQTTILARLGSFTGSGVNTILGFLKAALSKTATVPSDVGGTFDPATDSVEALRDRGDAAWITGGAGSAPTTSEIETYLAGIHGSGPWGPSNAAGANTVNVTVSDGATDIPNALVTIYASNGTTRIDQKYTSANGTVAFSLDSASYKVSVGAMPGYSSLAVQTLVVSTNPQSVTYTLTAIIPATPSSSLARTVYGYLYGPDGEPLVGKQVKASLSDKATAAANNALLAHATLTDTTDALGYWELALIIGANFTKGNGQFLIQSGNDSWGPVTIPSGSGAINVEDLL